MSKRNREAGTSRGPTPESQATGSEGPLRYATLGGLAVVLLVTGLNWTEARKLRKDLSERLTQLDTRVTQLSTKVEAAAKAPQPQQRGPDPNKVYTVKTDAAPSKGPAAAPITIAEFSDFQ